MIKLIYRNCVIFISFFSSAVFANQFSIAPNLIYNTDQDSTPGAGLFLNYTHNSFLEFEAGYIDSNDVNVTLNTFEQTGSYTSVLLGANIYRDYSESIKLTFGGGANYLLDSSNESIVEEGKISPYLKLSLQYKLSDTVAVEIGQIGQFSLDSLNTSQSTFLGVVWHFGESRKKPVKKAKTISRKVKQQEIASKVQETEEYTSEIIDDNSAIESNKPTVNQVNWYIQFGAFSSEKNANTHLQNIAEQAKQYNIVNLSVKFNKGLYRVVSPGFNIKEEADKQLSSLKPPMNAVVVFID